MRRLLFLTLPGILAVFVFFSMSSADAGPGEEPVKFAHPGFEVIPKVPTSDVHVKDDPSPPKPDAQRQGTPAQSDGPDRSKVSSRPVKPRQEDRSPTGQAKHPAADRTANPASPREKPVPNDQPSKQDAAARKGTTVPTPAGRDQSKSIAPPSVTITAVTDSEGAVRTESAMSDAQEASRTSWRDRRSWTLQQRRAWRDRQRDGASGLSSDDNRPDSASINTRPLTDNEIKQQVIANNEREREKRDSRRHEHGWTEVDRERWHNREHRSDGERRTWLQDHPRHRWTRDERNYWREHHQYFVPQFPSWSDENDPRRYRRHYSYYDRSRGVYYYPDFVTTTFVAPATYDPISVHGNTYYYSDGNFYQSERDKFSEVPPPVGASVSALPQEYTELTIRGVVYSTYNGVYYKKVGGGYEVTAPPPGFDGVLIYRDKTVNGDEAIVVKLPDPDVEGQYVDIKLSRFGQGFRGPQGEWYTEFPSIEQLQEEYLS